MVSIAMTVATFVRSVIHPNTFQIVYRSLSFDPERLGKLRAESSPRSDYETVNYPLETVARSRVQDSRGPGRAGAPADGWSSIHLVLPQPTTGGAWSGRGRYRFHVDAAYL